MLPTQKVPPDLSPRRFLRLRSWILHSLSLAVANFQGKGKILPLSASAVALPLPGPESVFLLVAVLTAPRPGHPVHLAATLHSLLTELAPGPRPPPWSASMKGRVLRSNPHPILISGGGKDAPQRVMTQTMSDVEYLIVDHVAGRLPPRVQKKRWDHPIKLPLGHNHRTRIIYTNNIYIYNIILYTTIIPYVC